MSRWLDWSEMYCCTIEKVSIDNYNKIICFCSFISMHCN